MSSENQQPGSGQAPSIMSWLVFLVISVYLLAATGFATHSEHGVYNGTRLWETHALLLALCVTALVPELRRSLTQTVQRIPGWIMLSFTAALAIAAISSLRFAHPGYGLAEPALIGLFLLLSLCVAASRHALGSHFDRAAMLLIAAIGLVVAVQEAMGFAANWTMNREFSYDQMLIQFAHPRFYNQLQSWTLPLLAGLPFLFGRSGKVVFFCLVLLAVQWCILLVSGGRGTFVSVLSALLLLALVARRAAKPWLALHAVGFLLGGLLFGAIVVSQPALAPEGGALLEESIHRPMAHTSGRFHLWRLGLDQAAENPWLGSGPGRYSCHVPPKSAAHPHNFIIQLMAEWGLPATLLVVVPGLFLGLRLLRGAHSRSRSPGPVDPSFYSLAAASVCAAALHANLSGVLMTPASQVLGALVAGWMIALATSDHVIDRDGPRFLVPACLAIGLALALTLTAFAWVEIGQMETRMSRLDSAHPDVPRFWQSGRVCAYFYEETPTW